MQDKGWVVDAPVELNSPCATGSSPASEEGRLLQADDTEPGSHGPLLSWRALLGVLNSVLPASGSQSSLSSCSFSLTFLPHVHKACCLESDRRCPKSLRVQTSYAGSAFCPPSVAHPTVLANQMIEQMFRFVVIACEILFGKINYRLKYLKGSLYLPFIFSFLLWLLFYCYFFVSVWFELGHKNQFFMHKFRGTLF